MSTMNGNLSRQDEAQLNELHWSSYEKLSNELWELVCSYLDNESLSNLVCASNSFQLSLESFLEERCKKACITTKLYTLLSINGMASRVPKTWRRLCRGLTDLHALRWEECEKGTGGALREMKSDRLEYVADYESGLLYRVGGHYFFSVAVLELSEVQIVPLTPPAGPSTSEIGQDNRGEHYIQGEQESEKGYPLSPFTSLGPPSIVPPSAPPPPTAPPPPIPLPAAEEPSLSHLVSFGPWKKVKAVGIPPSARRHHALATLPSIKDGFEYSPSDVLDRLLIFGGQTEGFPFDAKDDLHLLLVGKREGQQRPRGLWICPEVSGEQPSGRCGHSMTRVFEGEIVVIGGSKGTTAINDLEVFVLHYDEESPLGPFRWSQPNIAGTVPNGRSLHYVLPHPNKPYELKIFGGKQVGVSNALYDVQTLVTSPSDDGWHWKEVPTSGHCPQGRRGHSVTTVGAKLILFGGQLEDVKPEEALSDELLVLNVHTNIWDRPKVPGPPLSARRSHDAKHFGSCIVFNGGFTYPYDSSGGSAEGYRQGTYTLIKEKEPQRLRLLD